MESLLLSLLLYLLFELLILVSVPYLGRNNLCFLLHSPSAAVSSLTTLAALLRLVRLSHHNVVLLLLLLFLRIVINLLLFILVAILLVTDISMGIIIGLLEVSCLTLVFRCLRVHGVAASLNV